ncbi:MAG: serine--tRNA ligase [Candidatus Paceibacterota bacterium]|jgi:seryl-tRNA synthetase
MLDIKFIRENKEVIKEAVRKKKSDFNVEALLEADEQRIKLTSEVDNLRACQNEASSKISQIQDETERDNLIEQMKEVKNSREKKEEELKQVMETWKNLLLKVPNIPDSSVPEGKDDSENQEIKIWGDRSKFDFIPKGHIELMTDLKLVDFERGIKVSGFRGYFLKNEAVLLSFAIWQHAMKLALEDGFTSLLPPVLDRPENFMGTGYLPDGEEDLYKTQDNDYLAGTAEVPTMGYYFDEIVPLDRLPYKFIVFSPCYRREAGSHGKDTQGLIRVHEFYKVEQVILCEANHQESVNWHEKLLANAERFMQSLKIPYRVVINCAGDLGQGQVKKYDIEAWVPSEGKFRETHSISYFHDFQARRLNTRYRDTEGRLRFVHSLNGTLVASPRILVPLIENFQQADGSVVVPEALRPYLGKDIIK